jgi:hypothetical protein
MHGTRVHAITRTCHGTIVSIGVGQPPSSRLHMPRPLVPSGRTEWVLTRGCRATGTLAPARAAERPARRVQWFCTRRFGRPPRCAPGRAASPRRRHSISNVGIHSKYIMLRRSWTWSCGERSLPFKYAPHKLNMRPISVIHKQPLNPFPGLTCLNRLGIDGRTTWPVALKKDTVAPKYYWCRLIVCVLGQFLAQTKVGSLDTFRHYGCSPGTRPCLE